MLPFVTSGGASLQVDFFVQLAGTGRPYCSDNCYIADERRLREALTFVAADGTLVVPAPNTIIDPFLAMSDPLEPTHDNVWAGRRDPEGIRQWACDVENCRIRELQASSSDGERKGTKAGTNGPELVGEDWVLPSSRPCKGVTRDGKGIATEDEPKDHGDDPAEGAARQPPTPATILKSLRGPIDVRPSPSFLRPS